MRYVVFFHEDSGPLRKNLANSEDTSTSFGVIRKGNGVNARNIPKSKARIQVSLRRGIGRLHMSEGLFYLT